MGKEYLGYLEWNDPLYRHLVGLLHSSGLNGHLPAFRVFRLSGSKEVFLYEEEQHLWKVVAKFFPPLDGGSRGAVREFDNLSYLRSIGFSRYPHRVARPISFAAGPCPMLVVEYCDGLPFSEVIFNAVYRGGHSRLVMTLTAVASFLARLHNSTATQWSVDFHHDSSFCERVVKTLYQRGLMSDGDTAEMLWLIERWRSKPCMWEDCQVLVHGDATPGNFMIGSGLEMTAIDLEAMKNADRVFDVGRLAGELKHFFLSGTGDGMSAEPFIEHFLTAYASHFPDRVRAFHSITARVPFHMANALLRIARNDWVTDDYREKLYTEAKALLR
ncbi:MAG: phosphotransferase [Candidatus Xenobiia bacterium LiM19]